MAEVDQGQDPFAKKKQAVIERQREQLTFAELVDDYLSERRHLASATEIERELRKDVIPALGTKRPAEITPGDIDRLAATLLAPGRNFKVMARRLVQRIKALYNYAILDAPSLGEKYGIATNPATNIGRRRTGSDGRFGKAEPKTRVLSDAEVTAVCNAIAGSDMRKST